MSNSMNGSRYNNSRNRVAESERPVITAPYNFIEINERVLEAYRSAYDLPDARALSDQLLSGEISYNVEAKTHIAFEQVPNKSLTASMIRGLVRSNLQILSFSSVDDDIEDETYKYRNFFSKHYLSVMGKSVVEGKSNRSRYNEYTNIRAGFIRKTDQGWTITPSTAFEGKGYKTIKLTYIQSKYSDWRKRFNVSYKSYKNVFDSLKQISWSNRDTITRSKTIHEPFVIKVSWKEGTQGDVVSIREEGILENSAYLVNPSEIYRGVSMYLVPIEEGTADTTDRVELSVEDISNYERYLKRQGGNVHNRFKDFYSLPSEGEKPVFYILHDGHCEFGFSYLFPIQYLHAVKEGIPKSHKENEIDYCKAIFGFYGLRDKSGGKLNYQGRVSFLEPQRVNDAMRHITSASLPDPKPFSSANYLNNDNGEGYNAEYFRINGIKQYWLQNEINLSIFKSFPNKMERNIYINDSGTQYKGKVLFNNLREDELGLLIWSIGLNEGCDQNIGAAKQYGFGRVTITVTDVEKYLYRPVNSSDDLLSQIESVSLDPDHYISVFQEKLNLFLNGKLKTNKRLQDFFIMKNAKLIPDAQKTGYEFSTKIKKKLARFPKITDVASSQKWLIIPESIIEDIELITWEQFIQEPPLRMKEMFPEMQIYNAYKEMTEIMRLYESNHLFAIREEILREYLELIDRINTLIEKRKARSGSGSKSNAIDENIDICIRKINELNKVMEQFRVQFPQEVVPQLKVSVDPTVLDNEEQKINLAVQLSLPEESALIRVNYFQINADGEREYRDGRKFFLSGGDSRDVEAELAVSDSELKQSYTRFSFKLEYQYRTDNGPAVLEYEEVFEIPLLQGEYKELENPYSSWLGNPVSDQNMFFGRTAMLHEIMEKIDSCSNEHPSGRNIIIYGQKRTGKSTLLYFLEENLRSCEPGKYVVINIGNVGSALQIDLNAEDSGKVNLKLFFKRMIDAAEDELSDNHEDLFDEMEEEGFEFPSLRDASDAEAMYICGIFYEKLFKRLGADRRIILLIDEFTYFYDMIIKGYMDDNFMKFWKAFIQNTKICAVLIGQDYMDDFRNRFANEFGASDHIRISYLDREASIELIQKPFRKYNGYEGFNDESIEEMIRLTSGSAFYLMHMCSALVSYLNVRKRGRVVTEFVLNDFLSNYWMNADSPRRIDRSFFESLYNDGTHPGWDDDNLTILHEIAEADTGSGAKKDELLKKMEDVYVNSNRSMALCREQINRLVYRDVLSERGRMLKIRVALFVMWLKKIY